MDYRRMSSKPTSMYKNAHSLLKDGWYKYFIRFTVSIDSFSGSFRSIKFLIPNERNDIVTVLNRIFDRKNNRLAFGPFYIRDISGVRPVFASSVDREVRNVRSKVEIWSFGIVLKFDTLIFLVGGTYFPNECLLRVDECYWMLRKIIFLKPVGPEWGHFYRKWEVSNFFYKFYFWKVNEDFYSFLHILYDIKTDFLKRAFYLFKCWLGWESVKNKKVDTKNCFHVKTRSFSDFIH